MDLLDNFTKGNYIVNRYYSIHDTNTPHRRTTSSDYHQVNVNTFG